MNKIEMQIKTYNVICYFGKDFAKKYTLKMVDGVFFDKDDFERFLNENYEKVNCKKPFLAKKRRPLTKSEINFAAGFCRAAFNNYLMFNFER